MEIIRLKKKKLGDDFSLIEVEYKNFWGRKFRRDAYSVNYSHNGVEIDPTWKWVDNDWLTYRDELLNQFFNSSDWEYNVNK